MRSGSRLPSADQRFLSGISQQLLSREEQAQQAAAPPPSFREFTDAVRPGFIWRRHNIVLANRLQQVADGVLKRLMVFEPPRHGKSEQVSRLFPGYVLHRHPGRWVGLASYNSDLANDLAVEARDFYVRAGNRLAHGRSKIRQWQTFERGGMWSAGIGGSVTGRGFDYGIIDDPVKDQVEASSARTRKRNQDWYESTFETRQQNDEAAIVIVLTRWPPRDLATFILEREADPATAEGWHIICLPGLAEAPKDRVPLPPDWEEGDPIPREFPKTCTIEEDWRKPGEALAPDIRSREEMLKQKARTNRYWFEALIQQRPRPREGSLFKMSWFKWVAEVPDCEEYCRFWDLAATEGGGDWTVGTLVGRRRASYYVIDVRRFRKDPGARDAEIDEVNKHDRNIYGKIGVYTTGVEQEPGSSGKDVAQEFIRRNVMSSAWRERATGPIETRMAPFAAACQNGDVFVKEADWNHAWTAELTSMPTSDHDDQGVSAAGGFKKIALDQGGVSSVVGRPR